MTVKVSKSQIFLQGSLVMWNKKIAYSFHTTFQRGNACRANAVAEEIESGDTKLTLVRVDDQPTLRQMCEESLQVLVMLFRCVAGYQDIIHVNKDKGELPADLIHKTLEGLCSIPESVRHHEIFIKTKGVIMAVFGMSSWCTGICLKARTRSTLEKIVAPRSDAPKSWM